MCIHCTPALSQVLTRHRDTEIREKVPPFEEFTIEQRKTYNSEMKCCECAASTKTGLGKAGSADSGGHQVALVGKHS